MILRTLGRNIIILIILLVTCISLKGVYLFTYSYGIDFISFNPLDNKLLAKISEMLLARRTHKPKASAYSDSESDSEDICTFSGEIITKLSTSLYPHDSQKEAVVASRMKHQFLLDTGRRERAQAAPKKPKISKTRNVLPQQQPAQEQPAQQPPEQQPTEQQPDEQPQQTEQHVEQPAEQQPEQSSQHQATTAALLTNLDSKVSSHLTLFQLYSCLVH